VGLFGIQKSFGLPSQTQEKSRPSSRLSAFEIIDL